MIRRFGKKAAGAILGVALLFFVATPPAHADERDRCRHAIEKAEVRLDKAVQRRGEHSREADERRRELNAERERCWSAHHQWWNEREHRWETEHNWEDRH